MNKECVALTVACSSSRKSNWTRSTGKRSSSKWMVSRAVVGAGWAAGQLATWRYVSRSNECIWWCAPAWLRPRSSTVVVVVLQKAADEDDVPPPAAVGGRMGGGSSGSEGEVVAVATHSMRSARHTPKSRNTSVVPAANLSKRST